MNSRRYIELMSLEMAEMHLFKQKQRKLQLKNCVTRNINEIFVSRSQLLAHGKKKKFVLFNAENCTLDIFNA